MVISFQFLWSDRIRVNYLHLPVYFYFIEQIEGALESHLRMNNKMGTEEG